MTLCRIAQKIKKKKEYEVRILCLCATKFYAEL